MPNAVLDLEALATKPPRQIEADLLTWCAVHGYLCLALRQPEAKIFVASYAIVEHFARTLGRDLVSHGVPEELISATERGLSYGT